MKTAILAIAFALFLACAYGWDSGPVRLVFKENVSAARGHVGGESHDQYSIDLPAGAKVTIQLSSRHNSAEFVLSTQSGFATAEPVRFGTANEARRLWTGTIRDTKTYYIYVTAHPSAQYRLQVRKQ
jgi:hypothetical protein